MPCWVCSGKGFQEELCDECVEGISESIQDEILCSCWNGFHQGVYDETVMIPDFKQLNKIDRYCEFSDFIMYLEIAVRNRQFKVAECLLKIKPELLDKLDQPEMFYEHENHKFTFNMASRYGDFILAKWLLKVKPSIIITSDDLVVAISQEHFDFAEWLVEIKPNLNTYFCHVMLFTTCEMSSLQEVKWFLKMNPSLNISDKDFHFACWGGRLETVQWITELNPERYKYRILNDNTGANKIEPQIDHSSLKLVGMVEREKETCCICQTNNVNCETLCDHRYCLNCIKTWFNSSKSGKCPYCRCEVGAEVKMVKFV